MKNAIIIYNPQSGSKSNKFMVDRLVKKYQSLNINYTLFPTQYKGHAEFFCSSKDILKYQQIIVCGGDGTFNEIVNGLIQSHKFQIPPIGFLPGGTGNAFMHDLKALDPDRAIEIILRGKIKKIDVLKLEYHDKQEYSINIVGWGMVTDILVLAEKMRMFGSARYTLASLFLIFKKSIRDINVAINNAKAQKKKYIFILVTNTIHTGKGMKAAPKALLDDGMLDVIFLRSTISKFQLLMLFPKLFTGEHIHSAHVKYINVKNIELIPDVNEVLNIDGEVKGETPVKISVIPKCLSIYSS